MKETLAVRQAEEIINRQFEEPESYARNLREKITDGVITVGLYATFGVLLGIGIGLNFAEIIGRKATRDRDFNLFGLKLF